MILFKIDPQRIAVIPLERDAPRTVDVNTVMLEASDHTRSVTLLATMSTVMLQVIYEVEYDQLETVIA
jgi:hypothetical protein